MFISGRRFHGHEGSGVVHREPGHRVVLVHLIIQEEDHIQGRRLQGH